MCLLRYILTPSSCISGYTFLFPLFRVLKENAMVDDNSHGLDETQIQHLLQFAEAIRKDYPNED